MVIPPSISMPGRLLGPVFVLIFAIALSMATERTALFYHVDSWFADAIDSVVAPGIRFDDVLIVDLDDASLEGLEPELGSWPYKRDVFALVAEHLGSLGARVIACDLNFSDIRDGDDRFAAALEKTPNVWLAAQGYGYRKGDPDYEERLKVLVWQAPKTAPARTWLGFRLPNSVLTAAGRSRAGAAVVSFEPDADGILRRMSLLHRSGAHYLPSMPLASMFSPRAKPPISQGGSVLHVGSRSWPIDSDGNVYVRAPANRDMFESISFERLYRSATGSKDSMLDRSLVEGRTVFIGSRAARLGDYVHLSRHGRIAGIDMLALAHVNLSHNLIVAPRSKVWLAIFCVLGAVVPLLAVNLRSVPEWVIPAGFAAGASVVTIIHIALLAFFGRQSALLLPLFFNAVTLLGQVVLRMRTLHEERRRYYLEKLAADEANALKSQFLSHMTHELRTPLSAILGYTRLLAEPGVDDNERMARVSIIEKNCRQLLSLINNLLDQAKIEAGQMPLDFGEVHIKSLLGDVIETLRPIADQKGLEIRCTISDKVPDSVRADELRIRQILLNIGGNAVRFTNEGRVAMDMDWREGWLKIDISDTGGGISGENMAHIFDAFRQADSSVARSHGGTGLGLSISQNLARLMGGEVRVNSSPGLGSTFTLEVPAEAIERSDAIAAKPALPSQYYKPRGRVLVAEDTEDLRNLLSLYLKRLGVEVLLAINGEEAVNMALTETPELIFMDMQMPVLDGLGATRALREKGYAGKILALTAQSDQKRIEETLHAGCDGFIEKPISRARLREVLMRYLPAEGKVRD